MKTRGRTCRQETSVSAQTNAGSHLVSVQGANDQSAWSLTIKRTSATRAVSHKHVHNQQVRGVSREGRILSNARTHQCLPHPNLSIVDVAASLSVNSKSLVHSRAREFTLRTTLSPSIVRLCSPGPLPVCILQLIGLALRCQCVAKKNS